jgi:dTDP-4-dehydrorhamnose reductase
VRIAVVGAGGQLGAATVHECSGAHDVIAFQRSDVDVTSDRAIAAAIDAARPDAIVNCAAYNNVDAAEDHVVDALAVNAFAVRAMAQAAESAGAIFVHFGTDFVFDGAATQPYTEDDRPSPRSVYGASKMLGEWFAVDVPRAYVLRVESLFGGSPSGPLPRGTVASIVKALRVGDAPKVFHDRTVSPTYIPDAARAIRFILESPPAPGIYHCVNSGSCTWLEFATELARQLGIEPKLTPVSMADVPLRAQRPRFCALSNEKLRRAGIDMPWWQDAVARFAVATSREDFESRRG